MDAEKTDAKQRGRAFRRGQSGNPAGRPKGARNRATLAAEAMLDGEASALTRKAIDLALGGDTTALRLCLERLLPPRKDRAFALPLPTVKTCDDAREAVNAVLLAVSEGRITLGEASAAIELIEACKRAIGPEAAPPPKPIERLVRISFAGVERGGSTPE